MNAMTKIRAVGRSERTGSAAVVAAGPVRFTMPCPPSTNKLWFNMPGKGRVKTAAYSDFVQMGLVAISNQKVPSVNGRVLMVYGIERIAKNAMDADISNRLKAIEDTIVKAGIIEDDSMVVGLAISWLPRANGLAHVAILPVEDAHFQFQPSPDGACGAWVQTAPQPHGDDNGYQPE